MNYFGRCGVLFVFLVWAGGVGALEHQPLVQFEEGRGFCLDENFKFHHTGLLECIDFVYKTDIGRYFVDEQLKKTLVPASETSFGAISLEVCEEAVRLAEQAAGTLQERYQLTVLEGVIGDAEAAYDLSTCFAYHEATNTLIMAFCGMDEAPDKENLMDATLMAYPDKIRPAVNVLVHKGLFERVNKEFKEIVRPAFLKKWKELWEKDVSLPRTLSIIVVGHSLGGGRALMHATFLAEWLGVHWYGQPGNWQCQPNKIKVYNLSGIIPGNAAFVEYMETLIGVNNILTQATAFDKGPALQPGHGGYTGTGVIDFVRRYHNAACPIPGWYAHDYARDVRNRNYEKRYEAWLKRRQKYTACEMWNPKNWPLALSDRHKSFIKGPLHYMAAMHEFYNDWFDPAIIGGYGDPSFIEKTLLPQGIRAQETCRGRMERYWNRWVTVVGLAAGIL